MRCWGSQKMSVFVHAQVVKTVHTGGEGVKKWQNSVHIVVEWPLIIVSTTIQRSVVIQILKTKTLFSFDKFLKQIPHCVNLCTSSHLEMGGLLLSEENNDAISFKSIFVFIHLINIANSYQKPIILSLKPPPLPSSQCPRTNLNKRFLPKPMTTTGWKETP